MKKLIDILRWTRLPPCATVRSTVIRASVHSLRQNWTGMLDPCVTFRIGPIFLNPSSPHQSEQAISSSSSKPLLNLRNSPATLKAAKERSKKSPVHPLASSEARGGTDLFARRWNLERSCPAWKGRPTSALWSQSDLKIPWWICKRPCIFMVWKIRQEDALHHISSNLFIAYSTEPWPYPIPYIRIQMPCATIFQEAFSFNSRQFFCINLNYFLFE